MSDVLAPEGCELSRSALLDLGLCVQEALSFLDQGCARNPQGSCSAQQQPKRRLPLTPLKLSIVRAINVRDQGELILRDTVAHSERTNRLAECPGGEWVERGGPTWTRLFRLWEFCI